MVENGSVEPAPEVEATQLTPQSPTFSSSSVGTAFSPSPARYHVLSYHPVIAVRSGIASVSLFISSLSSPPAEIRHAAVSLPPRERSLKPYKSSGLVPKRTRKNLPSASTTGRYVGPQLTTQSAPPKQFLGPRNPATSSPTINALKDGLPSQSTTGSSTTPATSVTDVPTPGSPLSSNTSTSSAPHREPTAPSAGDTVETDVQTDPKQQNPNPTDPVDATANAKESAKPAPLIKSFASLLRPSGSKPPTTRVVASQLADSDGNVGSEPAAGTYSRPAILSSAQIGFSVPAMDAKENTLAANLAPRQHANILKLLKTGSGLPTIAPANSGASASSKNTAQIIPRGLVNTGNLCFANAVLQALVYTPPFWRLFEELGRSGLKTDSTAGKDTPMIDAVVSFLNEFKPKVGPGPIDATSFPTASVAATLNSGSSTPSTRPASTFNANTQPKDSTLLPRNSFTASRLYNSLKSNSRFDAMRSGHQEDAEEFLGFFLDGLHEELCALSSLLGEGSEVDDPAGNDDGWTDGVEPGTGKETGPSSGGDEWQEVGKKNRPVVTRTTKSTESAITAVFGGKFRSVLRASGRPDSASVEEWRCLQLDIQPQHVRTIEDALHALSAIETVSIQNRHGIATEATKQVFVEQLPPILILHLKRFIYDPVTGIGKNGKPIKFGPELEIRSDLISPSLKRGHTSYRYRLYGVIYHHGLAATGGHYTLEVLHPGPIPLPETKDQKSASVTSTTPAIAAPSSGESWVRFDDENVRRLTKEDVFGHVGAGHNPLSFRRGDREDRAAYLLLYRRVNK